MTLSSSELRIVSANCNGLGSRLKKAEMLAHFDTKKPDILFLVDTRLGKKGQADFFALYPDFHFYFNSSCSQSRGVVIAINRKCPINIQQSWNDDDNNILMLLGSFDGEKVLLCCIYGPNSDSPTFYNNLLDKIQSFGSDHILLGGDWNLYLDPKIDSLHYTQIRTPGARKIINDAIVNGGFFDAFRLLNKDKVDFTWNRFGGGKSARLDYFLVSASLSFFVTSCSSFPAFKSDHKPIFITLDFRKVRKGKGLWKFDNSLLLDQNFTDLAKKEIAATCAKYLIHPDYDNFLNDAPPEIIDIFLNTPLVDLERLEFNIDYDLLIISIFNDIKNLCISYKSGKAKSNQGRAEALLKDISLAPNGPSKDQLLVQYENLLTEIANDHIKKISRISKLEGERPSRWFLRLEKNNCAQKFIGCIAKNDSLLTNQSDIEREIRSFYKNLYTASGHVVSSPAELRDFLPQNLATPKLTDSQAVSLESAISTDEIAIFLKKVNLDSAPGFTGISYGFIKYFFRPLGFFLAKASSNIFAKGIFPNSLKIGVISLLPKGDKDKKLLQNWRPIVLLDATYKIISGVLTNRINKVLPSLISIYQSGFVPGRCLNDSLRTLADVLEWGKNKNQAGIILSIDYRKAFDTLSHAFIANALSFFGFGPNFIKWVQITQNEFQACTSNAGNISAPFKLCRGVKQGDPLSPALFVLSLEILSLKIRHEPLIKGYKMGNFEIRASYFADDSVYILDRDENSVMKTVEILDNFAELSGLYMNKSKSALMEFGARPGIPFCPTLQFDRVKKITYLGLLFSSDLSNMEVNIKIKSDEIDKICKNWQNRKLSVYGKNILCKTLMLSKINNIIIILPDLPKDVIVSFETQIYKFLWQGCDQVRRSDAKIGESQGGLNLPNVWTSIHAFKIAWFRRLFSTKTVWANILNVHLSFVRQNLTFHDLLLEGDIGWAKIAARIGSKFWRVCLKAPGIPFNRFIKDHPVLAPDLNIWNCSIFKQGKRPFIPRFHPSLKNIITFASDLINPDSGSFFTLQEFMELHGNINTIQLLNIMHAVSSFLLSSRLPPSSLFQAKPSRPSWLSFFNITLKGCRGWTRLLRNFRSDNIRKREEKWETDLSKNLGPIFWDKTYKNLSSIQFSNTLKWFQYQINRSCLKTNAIICHFVHNQSDRCTFCDLEKETILHLFWDCPKIKQFYVTLEPFLSQFNIPWPPLSREAYIFGDHKSSFLCETEYVYLHIKHYIWVTRCLKDGFCLEALKNKLRFNINLDLFYSTPGGGGGMVPPLGQVNPFSFISILADRMGIG